MTLSELQDAVYTITNRPDLTTQTQQAVRAATLKCHQADFFYKDIYETGIEFSESLYEQDFEYRTFIPRFRAMKYARVWDATDESPLQFFEAVSPENVLDTYNIARTDVYYLGGAEIHFKCSVEFTHMLFGCYLNPDIAVATFDTNLSWIAQDHPFAIVYEAASKILGQIGNEKKAQIYRVNALEEIALIKQSNIQFKGE